MRTPDGANEAKADEQVEATPPTAEGEPTPEHRDMVTAPTHPVRLTHSKSKSKSESPKLTSKAATKLRRRAAPVVKKQVQPHPTKEQVAEALKQQPKDVTS